LEPVQRQAGLARVDACLFVPASMAGRAGVEELAGQTRSLFSMEQVEPEVFPLRMAFNLIPQVGNMDAEGHTDLELETEHALRQLLGEDLPVQVTALWVPVFYGAAALLHCESNKPLEQDSLKKWLGQADKVVVMDEVLPAGIPTPATDAEDSEEVFVGRIRVDARQPDRFSLWLVMDAVRLEAAQYVSVLENLIENASVSVIT